MKDHPITIGFDDATFTLQSKSRKTYLIGVICQGTRMVNVVKKGIQIDGDDSTQALIDLILKTQKHVQYVFTDTITFGGFNIADIQRVHEVTQKPIIAVTEREVNLDTVRTALYHKYPKDVYEAKLRKIIHAGELYKTELDTAGGTSTTFFHVKGMKIKEVEELLEKSCIDSKVPESVRFAHIIGRLF